METNTLAPVKVAEKDIRVLRSLLNLAGEQVGQEWTVGNEFSAGARLVDVDSPEGEALYEDLARDGAPAVALSRKRDFPARYLLHKPLRLPELRRVLAELAVAPSEQAERDAWCAMVLDSESLRLPLGEHLRRRTWTQAVAFKTEDGTAVILDPGSGVWFSEASDRQLSGLLERRLGPRDGQALSSGELVARTRGMNQQNLTNLRWRAGLALARGELHPDLAGPVRFMLPQLPLQVLSDTAYSRQARILLTGPMDIDTLWEKSGAEAEDVVEFLNACYTCGFLIIDQDGD